MHENRIRLRGSLYISEEMGADGEEDDSMKEVDGEAEGLKNLTFWTFLWSPFLFFHLSHCASNSSHVN